MGYYTDYWLTVDNAPGRTADMDAIDKWLNKLEREEKDKLLKYLDAPVETSARNRMGCSENWYDPYYAMKETFSREQIESMTEAEIKNLLALAQNISDGLY